jgi:beta-galactosidase
VRVISLSKNLNEGLSSVLSFKEPRLWSPETPYLYSVVSEIRDAEDGSLLDRTVSPLGLRWFRFDAAKGFFLNGKPYKLIGASRHQDFQGMGNALSDALQIRDVELLKEMGGNFLRVAHYPQDPAVLQACDRLGLLASVEIPVVNRITESEAFSENCRQMQREMIRQNFNHPSVIIWAYMNEVLLRPRYTDDKARQEQYFKRVAALARELEDIARKEDPSRYTMIPNHGNFDLYNRTGLTRIPMLVGWNLYQGWYGGELKDFGKFLDEHRRRLPDKPLLVTEYGADADERLQADNPLRFDKSVGYTLSYHRAYLKAMLERPFVAAAMVWNLSEFNSEERAETHPHVNDKGLLTLDRRIKDPYLFYQANLLKNPFLAIGSAGRTVRSGIAGANGFCSQTLDIFSNAKLVSLSVNGKKLSPIAPALGIARFQVPFMPGNNSIEAISDAAEGSLKDVRQIYFKMIPANLRDNNVPFTALNVSLGDKRFFNDERSREVWLPEKPYEPGSWGYIDGKVFAMKGNSRQSYGSDKNILETDYDPIFATQRTGIKEFKFDVPDGKYELTLHFAELLSEREQQQLAYNLDTGKATERDLHADRAFNVLINGQKVIENLNNKAELEPETAISYTFETEARDIKGITVSFEPLKGETILNGIQLRKIY